MANFFVNLRWKLYKVYSEQLLIWGLKKGYIQPYSEELIERLRDVYYGGVPASVLLLCRALTDGNCYDRALLMSRVFLEDDGDVRLIYATVADLKFNPAYKNGDGDHSFVERTTKTGKHFIYDTSIGFVYTKWIYWLINFPKVRHINEKDKIIKFVEEEQGVCSSSSPYVDGAFALDLIIPSIEANYDRKGEMYAMFGVLQREVEIFKDKVKGKDFRKGEYA